MSIEEFNRLSHDERIAKLYETQKRDANLMYLAVWSACFILLIIVVLMA